MAESLVASTSIFVFVSVEIFLIVLGVFMDGVIYHSTVVNKKENTKTESDDPTLITSSLCAQNIGFTDATTSLTTALLGTNTTLHDSTMEQIRDTVTPNIETTATNPTQAWDCVPRHGVYGGDLNVTAHGYPCLSWLEMWEMAEELELWPLQARLIPTAQFFHEPIASKGNKCRNLYNSTADVACYYYDFDLDMYLLAVCDVRTCDEDVDECSPNLCLNGATCVDEQYDYHCVCPEGYTGDRCELKTGECHVDGRYNGSLSISAYGTPCLDWELLSSNASEFNITLFPDDLTWDDIGNKCRHPHEVQYSPYCYAHAPPPVHFQIEPCDIPACPGTISRRPCRESSSAEPDCIPRHGVYAGDLAADCQGNPCLDWRTILNAIGAPVAQYNDINLFPDESWEELGNKCRNPGHLFMTPWCIVALEGNMVDFWHDCNAGFCESDVDECSPNLCLNGGTCIDGYRNYTCQCPDGYHGDKCQLADDDCRLGSQYEGNVRFAANWQPCINWDSVAAYITTQGGAESVYMDTWPADMGSACRYPFEWENRPFCFVLTERGTRNLPCAIPPCAEICSQSEPCLNGGTCVYEGTRCECIGFVGPVCEIELNECLSEPCLHGATCEDLINAFSCHCTERYEGTTCEHEIMPCDSNPCLSGGACANGEDNEEDIFVCECLPGYAGDVCQTDVDECASNPCENGGQCNDALNSYTCQCEHPFTGDFCEIEIFPCDSNPCQHSGTCTNEDQMYTCQCIPGYTGDQCQTDIDECASNPCEHGGQCMDAVNGFTCQCDYPYYGDLCESEATCFPRGSPKELYKSTTSQTSFGEPCIRWADAVQAYAYFDTGDFRYMLGLQHFPDHTWDDMSNHCRNPTQDEEGPWCMIGYSSYDWWYCEVEYCPSETADDCWPNPCMNGGTCIDGVDSFTCQCDNGYSGTRCQTGDCYSPSIVYNGRTNKDRSGRPCLDWELVVNIGFAPSSILNSFPDNSYDEASNYCRLYNGGDRVCYTIQMVDWEITTAAESCGIPQCTLPDCRIEGGLYAGSFTMPECWHWEDVYQLDFFEAKALSYLPSFPDANWHMLGSKCRDPLQSAMGEFCMAQNGTHLDRVACDIPACSDGDACTVNPCLNGGSCVIGGSGGEGVAYSCECPDGYHGALCESGECRFINTVYEGTLSVTHNGYGCLPWMLVAQFIPDEFVDSDSDLEAAGHYCRSPFHENQGPFCFVLKDALLERDSCYIPACEGETNCIQDNTEYIGDVTMESCQTWEDIQDYAVNDNPLPLHLFPDSSWSELGAKCRNPTDHEIGEWCPLLENIVDIRMIPCNLPACPETVTPCSRNPCLNGATCVDEDQSFTCHCPDGFMGALCETGDCYQFYDYYTGNTAYSNTGKRCYSWASLQTPPLEDVIAAFYFETSLGSIGNRCRNRKEFFGQPPQCFVYENNIMFLRDCDVAQCPSTECVIPGVPYTGNAGVTRCSRWEDLSLHSDIAQILMIQRLSNFPDASYIDLGDKCRNPNDDPLGEWCLIAENGEITPHYCDLPTCSGTTPCSQNPCLNGATCVDQQDGGYTCSCADGYLGVLCESGDCIDGSYTGDLSISMSGRPCLHWVDVFLYFDGIGIDTSVPTYAMPDAAEAGNKCRDAVLERADAPWCAVFVDSFITLEHCALPPCPGATTECVRMSAVPKYSGTVSAAGNSDPCAAWSTFDALPGIDVYPVLDGEYDDEENYCRDVYNIGRPLCMSVRIDGAQVPQFCIVPMCPVYMADDCSPNHCLNGGTCVDGHDTFTCTCPPGYWGELCESNECVTGDGSDYMGELSISGSRQTCVNWQKYVEYSGSNSIRLTNFPDQTWEQVGKKCRNPDPSSHAIPFCMVLSIDRISFEAEECALPRC